jgi:hypothetical protein
MSDTDTQNLFYNEEDALGYVYETIAPLLKAHGVGCRSITVGGFLIELGSKRAQIQVTLTVPLADQPITTGTT